MKRRLLVVASFALVSVVSFRPATALDLSAWSDDRAGADTEPATTVGTETVIHGVETDASEDGRVVAAIWSYATTLYGTREVKGSVGYTDGTNMKWSTPVKLNSTAQSVYHQTVSMAGDGRTVYVAWVSATTPDTTLDDLFVVTGAISVDPTSATPTVTWSSPRRFNRAAHQWWPSIDSSYDGTKVLMTHWDLASGGPYLKADVAQVAISGTTRSATWKGAATIVNNANTYSPGIDTAARMAVKVNRAGTRGAAAYWWSPNSTGNLNNGTIRAFFADVSNSLPFPSSLSGSAWSGPVSVSGADAQQNVPLALDFSDDGSKLLVGWASWAGTGTTDKKWVSTRVATLSSATSATWENTIKLYESNDSIAEVTANISADGSRTFASWQHSATWPNYSLTARVGTHSSGTTTWRPASTALATGGRDASRRSPSTVMSRDGTMAVSSMALASGTTGSAIGAAATNIWSDNGLLETDWNSPVETIATLPGVTSGNLYAPASLVSKDGSVITAVWASMTTVWARTTNQSAPTVSSVSPDTGTDAGGETITITGTDFGPGATVSIGGVACTNVVVVSSTQITCVIGAGGTGTGDVVVTNQNGQSGTGTGLFTFVSPPTGPLEVTNLTIDTVTGQTRTVTLSFNAPENAETWTLSGFLFAYRCLTKASVSAPCTGRWRLGSALEFEDDTVTNGQLISHTFQLPVSVAGTSGRPVDFRVIPVADDDDMTLGPTSDIGTIPIRDVPILHKSPLSTRDAASGRIEVAIVDVPILQLRGTEITAYSVEYTRNNRTWTTIPPPAGGWGPGKSRIVTVPTAGLIYYFRLKITTNSGTVYQNGFKSQLAR